ncbi:MAG: TlpA family protein disulfide reductase [Acidobacteria bacterium]|nr:TlpA family protein disulfide reductase [Acidobacteriota bacterium]
MLNFSKTFKISVSGLILVLFFFSNLYPLEEGPFYGNAAPDFRLKKLGSNDSVVLSKLKGKPVVLIFWATWCGPCKREIPQLKELYLKYAPKGVEFLAIAVGWRQTEEDVARFQTKYEIPYQILWDKDNAVSEKYFVQGIPTNLILDQDGVVRFRDFALTPQAEDVLQSLVKSDK